MLLACSAPREDAPEQTNQQAVAAASHFRSAVLKNAAGATVARVTFVRLRGDRVTVVATVSFPGIRAGFHGMHIHANDNPANGEGCVADPAQPANTHFVSADGHFNPTASTHGSHGGDTPGVNVLDDGSAFLSFVEEIDLAAIAGRAVILHEGMDNFGNIPVGVELNQYTANSPAAVTLTQNTGNAGNRIGCGLIQ
jgi:Cu-Zn family superoxide dismutase